MNWGLVLLQCLCIVIDYHFCLQADQLKVDHQCRCQTGDENCKLKLFCEGNDQENKWIGLSAFSFGWFENTRNCSSEGNSSFVLNPMKDNCSKTFLIYNKTMSSVSGIEKGDISNIFDRCSSSPDYFIVQYFCVPYKQGIIIGETCQRNVPNTQSISIYSKGFPHENISTQFPLCDCTLKTNASVLMVQTYDNRLFDNQTLALTHKNGTVIKQWKKPTNVDEMLGNDTVRVSNSELRLQWKNKASEPVGLVWIVIEVSNDVEYITVVCDQNSSTTLSSMTSTLTTTAAATALSNTTQGLSTSTAEIWNSSYITQSFQTLTEMNITSTLAAHFTSHLTRSSTASDLNITQTTKPLTSGTSNITHTTKSLTSGTSNNTHTTKSLTSGISNLAHTTKPLTIGVSNMAKQPEVTRTPNSNGKVNLGIIIGAACAVLLFLLILALCLVIWCKKKKQPQQVNTTPSQPSNSRFKQAHDAKENPGRSEDKTLHNKTNKIFPATNSSSVLSKTLPPLPVGRYVNHVSNFNKKESSDEEENEETRKHEIHYSVIDDIFRNHRRNTDENSYTASVNSYVERKTAVKDLVSNKHESLEMQSGKDANSDNGKKKKRKKKKWLAKKTQNMTEALLDESTEPQDSYNLREGEESVLSDF